MMYTDTLKRLKLQFFIITSRIPVLQSIPQIFHSTRKDF